MGASITMAPILLALRKPLPTAEDFAEAFDDFDGTLAGPTRIGETTLAPLPPDPAAEARFARALEAEGYFPLRNHQIFSVEPGDDGFWIASTLIDLCGGAYLGHYDEVLQGDGITNTQSVIIIEVQGEIRNVSLVAQSPSPTGVTNTSSVTVNATVSGALSSGQGIYLRYTTDNWANSTILPMSGSGTNYTTNIPAQTSGTTVNYYFFTSCAAMSIAHNDADFVTINGNTNNGANYQYTVLGGSSAYLLILRFLMILTMSRLRDATGTALVDAEKVYIHAGVSATQSNPSMFQYTTGNWGQDDGIGEMTETSANIWTISLTSLRSFDFFFVFRGHALPLVFPVPSPRPSVMLSALTHTPEQDLR